MIIAALRRTAASAVRPELIASSILGLVAIGGCGEEEPSVPYSAPPIVDSGDTSTRWPAMFIVDAMPSASPPPRRARR